MVEVSTITLLIRTLPRRLPFVAWLRAGWSTTATLDVYDGDGDRSSLGTIVLSETSIVVSTCHRFLSEWIAAVIRQEVSQPVFVEHT